MGLSIVMFDGYDHVVVPMIAEPITVVEGYGNHVGKLRLTSNTQRSLLVARHKAAQQRFSKVVMRPCVICSVPTMVYPSCPEDRVFCDKCTLLVDLD